MSFGVYTLRNVSFKYLTNSNANHVKITSLYYYMIMWRRGLNHQFGDPEVSSSSPWMIEKLAVLSDLWGDDFTVINKNSLSQNTWVSKLNISCICCLLCLFCCFLNIFWLYILFTDILNICLSLHAKTWNIMLYIYIFEWLFSDCCQYIVCQRDLHHLLMNRFLKTIFPFCY